MEQPVICVACNGLFRVQSVRYEPAPQVDKIIWRSLLRQAQQNQVADGCGAEDSERDVCQSGLKGKALAQRHSEERPF